MTHTQPVSSTAVESVEPTISLRFTVRYLDGSGEHQADRFQTRREADARAYYLRARGRACAVLTAGEASR